MAKKRNIEPGDNSKMLMHMAEVGSMGKVNLEDPEAVHDRIVEYFKLCQMDDIKPTMAGLSLSLGISRQAYWMYRMGKIGKEHKEVRDELNWGKDFLTALWESYMAEGLIDPVSGIFLGKNNYGYTNRDDPLPDEPEHLPEGKSLKALAEQYLGNDAPEGSE